MTNDRAKSITWGLLCGDAAGVPYEFKGPSSIAALPLANLPHGNWQGKTHAGAPKNAWSDDGAQALALLDVLLGLDEIAGSTTPDVPELVGQAILDWARAGKYACQRQVFDIGGQTSSALSRIRRGVPGRQSGGASEHENGNGSLMRVGAVATAAILLDQPSKLVQWAAESSIPTHAHPRSVLCCVWHAVTCYALGTSDEHTFDTAWEAGRTAAHDFALSKDADQPLKTWMSAFDAILLAGDYSNVVPRGTGYCVSSLWTAYDAIKGATSYIDAIQRAIAYGGDTDTSAAITGALAAPLWHGTEMGIPVSWQDALVAADTSNELGILGGQ